MLKTIAFAALSFLFSGIAPAQESIKTIKLDARSATKDRSEKAAFFARAQAAHATLTPGIAPGAVEVFGAFDDDGYVHATYLSQVFPAGVGCVGWRITASTGDTITEGPVCYGSADPFLLSVEMFRGSMSWAAWTGDYQFTAIVSTNNGPPTEVTGTITLGSAPASIIKDASLSSVSHVLSVSGAFSNPVAFYNGYELALKKGTGGFTATVLVALPQRLLTVCDGGMCSTQVLYKFN